MSSNEVKNECSSLSHIPRCYWVTSYLSHTETTDFWSESVQFSTESIQDSPIYGRVIKNGPIFGRVNRVKLPHGLGRMTEVGRWWHFAAHKVWWKNRGETIQRPIFLYFLTRNSFFVLRKRVRARKVEDFRMKNWIEYEENSSSDARRGHLRTSKFPNFSKGEGFPLWPLQSLRRRRWFSFVGDSRPPTRPFFHYLPGLCWIVAERECGVVNL